MKTSLPLFIALLVVQFLCQTAILAQKNYTVAGALKDADTNEPLIGASIAVGTTGVLADYDGTYRIELPRGKHRFKFSYVGFVTQEKEIDLQSDVQLNVSLRPIVMNEVVITADIAKERETPVAFSNISTLKIKEELASQDLPMLLNSTPGAYATRSGGGDGDARINIRGFNQRNVAVMLDGIPVNDMENGQVFWSNWAGLDLVTSSTQVQRGLGASKLSIPSIGGTINILTKGIDAKRSLEAQQEVGNNGLSRTSIGLSSGRLKGNWALSASAAYRRNDGWVDGNFSEQFFYYLRIDKQFGKHLLSAQGVGAPQKHGQRSFTMAISTVDRQLASDLGVTEPLLNTPTVLGTNRGYRYNQHAGLLNGEVYNATTNYFHKPQYSLRHSWQPNSRFFWSNIAYLSVGNGGGTNWDDANEVRNPAFYNASGQIKFDTIARLNREAGFLKDSFQSVRFIRSNINNHFWYGFLSTVKYDVTKQLSFSGGLDARYYRGDHWREAYDLLDGKFIYGYSNAAVQNRTTKLGVGDKYRYNYSGFVRWFGTFGLLEYKTKKWTAFANLSAAVTGYSAEDLMKPRIVTLADTTLFVTTEKPQTYKGTTYAYTSAEAKNQTVSWIDIFSYTAKGGASYRFNSDLSAFGNVGYISRPQRFSNVIYTNTAAKDAKEIGIADKYENEKIAAIELGCTYKDKILNANINGYYTNWLNKPLDFLATFTNPDGETVPYNVPGINALHKGIESEISLKVTQKIALESWLSFGDWKWTSGGKVQIVTASRVDTFSFDATGVHVGDAAQTQVGFGIRYEPIRGLYVKLKGTYFGRNFANFRPEDLRGPTARRESWEMPHYTICDLHAGYNFKWQGTRLGFRFNVLNVLDAKYISDGNNNVGTVTAGVGAVNFDAASAGVFFGLGRQWSASVQVSF